MTLRRALYNPGVLRKEELVAGFVARKEELSRLLAEVRAGGKQHHLVIGQRGAGKSTLLLRLAFAIEEEPELAQRALALRFPEEQYNVARLSDFWLNCVDSLIDALEDRGEAGEAARLDAEVATLDQLVEVEEEPERARRALAALVGYAAKAQRLLVLLVDNVDLVLQRLAHEHWALRDALSQPNGLMVVGACSSYPEELITYESAFYDFFHLQELGPLNEEEARATVLHLAEVAGTPHVAQVLREEPGRFRALLVLSGGMPRTLALLHGILASESSQRAEEDLELLLDQVTPYYKARFEELPAQSQLVLDAVALHWHPIPAAECAARARLEINAASAQLNRLCKQGVLAKSQGGESSRLLFSVQERFFNLWYLMRASRRLRRRLLWLTGFLQTFYGQVEVERRAKELLQTAEGQHAAADPARLLAFASAVEDVAVRRQLELYAIESVVCQPRQWGPPAEVLELEGEDRHLAPAVERVRAAYDVQGRMNEWKARAGTKAADSELVWKGVVQSPLLPMAVKRALSLDLKDKQATKAARFYGEVNAAFGPRLVQAIERGILPALSELSDATELRLALERCDHEEQRAVVMALAMTGSLPMVAAPKDFVDFFGSEQEVVFALLGLFTHAIDAWPVVERVLCYKLAEVASPASPWLRYEPYGVLHLAGRAKEAAELLQRTGKHELALPLYEALLAASSGGRGQLIHLAPELRAPAEMILQVMWEVHDEAHVFAERLDDHLRAAAATRPAGTKRRRPAPKGPRAKR